MKIALFSDLHAHPFKNGTIDEHGRNSRVEDAVSVIRQVYTEGVKRGVDYVLFGGDLFDRRKSIDVDTYNRIHEVISTQSLSIPTYMIPGNHDQANKSGTIHALQRFQTESCFIFQEPQWVKLNSDTALFGVPYYDDGELIAQYIVKGLEQKPKGVSKTILLMHYGIAGAKIGPSDYVLPCELSVDMLKPDKWDIIFGGHYHIGQQLGEKFNYIGSAMQHRWDDAGFEKSFVILDTSNWSMERVPTVAPRFVVFEDLENFDLLDVRNCFVRVVLSSSPSDDVKDMVFTTFTEAGALSLEFRITPPDVDEDSPERIEFKEGKGVGGVLEDYIKSDVVDTKGFDVDKLLQIGKAIIQEATHDH
jgi:DNA repair exonuclease SbcCD nuclease subunit